MADDAKTRTVAVLTSTGVVCGVGPREPLEPDEAARVYELLVDVEGVLAPGPGTSYPDGRPGAAHVLDVDLASHHARGNDARTLTAVVLTSRAVRDVRPGATPVGGEPLQVDEALAVYEVLVEEEQVLVPSASTYYPGQWRDRGDGLGVAVTTR